MPSDSRFRSLHRPLNEEPWLPKQEALQCVEDLLNHFEKDCGTFPSLLIETIRKLTVRLEDPEYYIHTQDFYAGYVIGRLAQCQEFEDGLDFQVLCRLTAQIIDCLLQYSPEATQYHGRLQAIATDLKLAAHQAAESSIQ